ncbi:MAG: hypothetical protein ACXABY_19100 [Candidatus Thorarchaeota archaeon]|jgi:hypothetical protein
MQDINVIRKLELTVGELRKINADYRSTVGNKFIELFFERLQSKRLSHLERLVGRNSDEQSRDYWAGYTEALKGVKSEYDKLAKELDEVLKAG